MTSPNLEAWIDTFLLTIEASGNVESNATVLWNRRKMKLFVTFVQERQIDNPLTPQTFLEYAAYLKKRSRFDNKQGPLSVYYRHGCIQVLRRFGTWLHQNGYVDNDLGDVLKPPRLPQRPKLRSIDWDDMAKMIAGSTSLRDRVALMTLRDTGCRAEELIDMRWRDVSFERAEIVVTGKRRETRVVHLSPATIHVLADYKETVPNEYDDPVWWGYLNRKDKCPLSYRGFYAMMYRLAHQVGVEGRWNPHSWRHAYGRNMTRNGCPTATLSQLMGHSSERVTLMYSVLDDPDLKAAYQKYSPYLDME